MAKTISEDNGVEARYEGYIMDLLEVIVTETALNYTLNLIDIRMFDVPENLKKNKSDIFLADFSISVHIEHSNEIDFSIPFMTDGLTLLMKKPSKSDSSVFSFLSPLSLSTWLYIFIAYIIVSLLLAVITRY